MLRLWMAGGPWPAGAELDLDDDATRHVQVRRLQPGAVLALFDGRGSEWPATLLAMGRRSARVRLGPPARPAAELPWAVTLAFGMPAGDRVDALVEKATELGAAALQPLHTERSVLRLSDERAARRRGHWQAVAAAAAGQCGRAWVPEVKPVQELAGWLQALPPADKSLRWLLAPGAARPRLPAPGDDDDGMPAVLVLSGPEGGLAEGEMQAAHAAGFVPVGLGPRVLRADTAPLALLAWLGIAGL